MGCTWSRQTNQLPQNKRAKNDVGQGVVNDVGQGVVNDVGQGVVNDVGQDVLNDVGQDILNDVGQGVVNDVPTDEAVTTTTVSADAVGKADCRNAEAHPVPNHELTRYSPVYHADKPSSRTAQSIPPTILAPHRKPPYTHRQLQDLRKGHFRLLQFTHINGITWYSPIHCSLTAYELEDGKHPEFAALSHGQIGEARNIPILVDGQEMRIAASLDQALRQLREFQMAGTLQAAYWWADEICIDQDNPEETTARTKIMDVFSQALYTVAWLGPADAWCDKASEAIRQRKFGELHLTALDAFLKRPYWKQVWILQELSPSHNIQIAFGDNLVSWGELEDFFSAYKYSSKRPNPHFASATMRIRKIFRQEPVYSGAALSKTRTLAEFIRESYLHHASDNRDKVYALLGLARDGCGGQIQPDYTVPDCGAFSKAIRAMWMDYESGKPVTSISLGELRSLKTRMTRHPHNPFNVDIEWRRQLHESYNGYCTVYAMYLSVACGHWDSVSSVVFDMPPGGCVDSGR